MTASHRDKNSHNYYSGGLAEITSSPSRLTFSFFKNWFSGNGSLGKAMDLLGLPYVPEPVPVLTLVNGNLYVDLNVEESILYHNTILKYKIRKSADLLPELVTDSKKVINPICIANTLKLSLKQSKWIANPRSAVLKAKNFEEMIPESGSEKSIESLDSLLKDKVWPEIIAIGFLCEFFARFIEREAGARASEVNTFIAGSVSEKDWFFKSIQAQADLKNGVMSLKDYMKNFGLRADKDYEIDCPRWYEIEEEIIGRAGIYKDVKKQAQIPMQDKLKKYIEAEVDLQLIRIMAKKKALIFIDKLRKAIIDMTGTKIIGDFTREELLEGKVRIKERKRRQKQDSKRRLVLSGTGVAVSKGEVEGVTKFIDNNSSLIGDDVVGIFPNASPEFAAQFPKCKGLVFLSGGLTSHGSIVAREFNIPAVIDKSAAGLKDGSKIRINGGTGEWSVK